MSAPLKNPPVYFTVAQVRFNPILKLADFLPTIQEGFRHARFPDFIKRTTIGISVEVKDGQVTPTPQAVDRYFFGNAAKTHNFILEANSLTFQSTDYGRFESFSHEFLKGLARIHEVVQLDFTERVGLRYLDKIVPLADDDLREYLVHEALGLSAKLGGDPVHSFCETMTVVRGIRLVSRAITQSGPLAFPPDLSPLGLEVAERFKVDRKMYAILDNDGFFEGREPYSADAIRDHLDKIHELIRTAFRSIATDYAFKRWNE
jgi:uncharacterized protein (TIGR04255 family)